MTELSSEAIVAGQAASSAVEELHEREAVEQAAITAELSAGVAEVAAANAEETARQAAETASIAVETAAQAAAESREVASETIETVAERTVSRDEYETFRSEMAPLLEFYANAEAARIAELEKQEQIQEIGVADGIGTGPAGNTGPGNTGPDGNTNTVTVSRRKGFKRGRR
jgi:hypothetical protein